jgi:ubiquinone biosynthesis protein UbiJ
MAFPHTPFTAINDAMEHLHQKFGDKLKPPEWLTYEMQNRLVLFLNHVLGQEPQAQARLSKQAGRVVRVQWRSLSMQLRATAAGLWELAPDDTHDLLLTLTDNSPIDLAQRAFRGERPSMRIEGDVELASDINWLVDNVRWDVEDDLARVIGGTAAHQIASFARTAAAALERFVSGLPKGMRRKSGTDASSGSGSATGTTQQPDSSYRDAASGTDGARSTDASQNDQSQAQRPGQ